MIDLITTVEGQNNSARFFIYDNLKINPVTVFAMFMVSMLLISLTVSGLFILLWTSAVILISSAAGSFRLLVLKPLYSFRIFLFFSFAFSYISAWDIKVSLLFLAKVSLLMILSRLFNYFTDFRYLLDTFDIYFSALKPLFLKRMIRKTLFSMLLGIEFVSELFSGAKGIAAERSASGAALVEKNAGILKDLFVFSFNKAVEMENIYGGKTDFSESKKISFSFNIYDALILTAIILNIYSFLSIK